MLPPETGRTPLAPLLLELLLEPLSEEPEESEDFEDFEEPDELDELEDFGAAGVLLPESEEPPEPYARRWPGRIMCGLDPITERFSE